MGKYLDSKVEAFVRIDNLLEENKDLVAPLIALKRKHDGLIAALEILHKMRTDKKKDTSGLTQEKKSTKEQMAELATQLAKGAYVWAKDEGKTDLLPTLDVEKTDITNAPVADAIVIASNVEKILRDNLTDLGDYGIEAASVDELKRLIADLGKASPLPRQQQGKNKVAHREHEARVKETDDLIDDIEGLIISKFLKTNRTFVNQFLAARRIFDPATRSTQLSITVLDKAGKPLEGVYCDLLQVADEEQYTDLLGKALIQGLKSGVFTLRLTSEGYKTVELTVDIKRGQRVKVEVQMEKE